MKEHVSIRKTSALSEGLDFDALRLQGIAYLQETCGDIWTDYNDHDPGVTLLEHLSFTLTDLAYRAGFDIKEVLYANEEKSNKSIENGFFSSVEILPTTPVTPTDYRKLLIDRIRDIRNAWFDPIDNHLLGYQGLFRVRIQLAEDIDRTSRREQVVNDVRVLIMEHRNLCEDLDEIIVLKTEHLNLSATISIEADAFGEKVLANILHTLEQLLNPGIRFYSREELIAEGQAIEDIFEGPEPFHGFIKKEDLRPLPENTHISTLREAISKVSGVRLVESLIVWKEGQRIHGDEILPSPDAALSLHPDLADSNGKEGSIRLWRNGVPVSINPLQTHQFLNTLKAKAKKGFQIKLDLSDPPVVSTKSFKGLAQYRSFQRLLPAVYGIGPEGLPATANRERRAKANQLKAYLLLFEQFMADYLIQLANVRNLFSIASEDQLTSEYEEHPATYFTQFLADVPNVHELYHHGKPPGTPAKEIQEAILENLHRLSSAFDPSDQRRNRFLDHLLARFGEVYNGDFLQLITSHSKENLSHQLIKGKASFLRNYPKLSSNRSKAFDYTQNAWENENISGLKKRVALLLNINEIANDGASPKRRKYHNRFLSKTEVLEEVQLQRPSTPPPSGISLPFKKMLRLGGDTGNYDIIQHAGGYELYFQDKGAAAGAENVEGQSTHLFTGSMAQCLAARNRLIDRFHKINAGGEGFFFLENILLRPMKTPGSILVLESQLPVGPEKIQLRSLFYSDEKSLNDLSTEILVIATRPSNWTALYFEDHWRIILLKNDQPMLVSSTFDTKDLAEAAKDHMVQFCLDIRDKDPASINNYLRLESEHFPGFDISNSFYSLKLSIIAPAWPALFQENDFRQLFHQVVETNIPTHLTVSYYWLEVEEMAKFEDLFKNWLEVRREEDWDAEQNLSLDLITFLRPAEANIANAGMAEDKIYHNLPAAILTKLGATFGYSFLFPENDFSFIQDLNPEAIKTFPDLSIDNWAVLQSSNPNIIIGEGLKSEILITKAEVRNWQKQAALAKRNRWTDLLRYQRRGLATGTGQPQTEVKPTKVERATQALLRHPEDVLASIRRWLSQLPDKQFVPYPVLNFLIELVGYGIILPENDLRIFSCIDANYEQALNDRGVYTWPHLDSMKSRTWNSVLQERNTEDEVPYFPALKQEISLALTGKWEALIKLQEAGTIEEANTSIQEQINHHLEILMAPLTHGERPLVSRLRMWKLAENSASISRSEMNQLVKVMTLDHLLSSRNFQVFEGIGKKTDAALKDIGISNWRQLAKADAAVLRNTLKSRFNASVLNGIGDWISQARLANDGKWSALIEWQKGPVTPSQGMEAQVTQLEKSINRWIKTNGRPASQSPTS